MEPSERPLSGKDNSSSPEATPNRCTNSTDAGQRCPHSADIHVSNTDERLPAADWSTDAAGSKVRSHIRRKIISTAPIST